MVFIIKEWDVKKKPKGNLIGVNQYGRWECLGRNSCHFCFIKRHCPVLIQGKKGVGG